VICAVLMVHLLPSRLGGALATDQRTT